MVWFFACLKSLKDHQTHRGGYAFSFENDFFRKKLQNPLDTRLALAYKYQSVCLQEDCGRENKMKTYTPKQNEIEEQWFIVDAANQTLGRMASRIALVLRGKNDPRFTPHANMRNHVIVINTEQIQLTGNKWTEKTYHKHTGWVGHLNTLTAKQLHEKDPNEMVRAAIWGMIPHNSLGRQTMKRLRLYSGADHPHEGQKPQALDLSAKKA